MSLITVKFNEEVKSVVLGIFTASRNLAGLKRKTFIDGLENPENPQFKKYYSKWSKEKLSTVVSMINALEQDGFSVGGEPATRNAEMVEALDRHLNTPAPRQPTPPPVTQKSSQASPAQKVEPASNGEPSKVKLKSRPVRALGFSYRKRVVDELIRDASREFTGEALMEGLEKELWAPRLQKTLDIISGHVQDSKKTNYWEKYMEDLSAPGLSGVSALLQAKEPLFQTLARVPDLHDKLGDVPFLDMALDINAQVRRIRHEEKLIAEWSKARPTQAGYAKNAATSTVNMLWRGAPEELKKLLVTAFTSGYRNLDAHFTGRQSFEGTTTYRRLDLTLSGLPPEKKRGFDKLGFIQVGHATGHTYGAQPQNQAMLEAAMLECTYPGKNSNRPYSYDNFVNQYAQSLAPILTMPPHKLTQKGLSGPQFISSLAEILDVDSPTAPHTESHTRLSPPQGMLTVVPREWLEAQRLSPQILERLGIPAYVHPGVRVACAEIREKLPDFSAAVQNSKVIDLLACKATLKPVLSRLVVAEMLSMPDRLNMPELGAGALDRQLPAHRPTSEKLDDLLKSTAKRQAHVVKAYMDLNNQEVAKSEVKKVEIEPGRNWADHKDWILLGDHITDMQVDGLSKRTMKMAGVHSVTAEEDKDKILSRCGRSPSKDRVYLGRLLVFPNPLIIHEAHSKTDLSSPKYVAPDHSCSPPMLIPAQAKSSAASEGYLRMMNGEGFESRMAKLDQLREAEREIDIKEYRDHLEQIGFTGERAGRIAGIVYHGSTASKIYDAYDDPTADIEITEGQKKAYKMFQSYGELLRDEDKEFMSSLPTDVSDEEVAKLASSRPARPNKLFACSPGVWALAKSWKKFNPEEKALFLEATGAKDPGKPVSPVNPACKYVLNPSWMHMVPFGERRVIITYDQDADVNVAVAHSITSLGQAVHDLYPKAQVEYRFIVERNNAKAKGADDFIVAHGNKPFWDDLEIGKIARNADFNKMKADGPPYLRKLVELAAEQAHADEQSPVM